MSTHGGEDIHGQWPGKIAGKQEETRSLENMKKPEERKEEKKQKKGTEEKNRFSSCQFVSWSDAQLPFDVFNVWMCVDINRACIWKRTRQPTHLQNDLAMLATWLWLLCMSIIQHDSMHFLMKMDMFTCSVCSMNNLPQVKCILWNNCIMCYRSSKHNPPQQFSLDAKWRITGHCNAYHPVLVAAMHAIPS